MDRSASEPVFDIPRRTIQKEHNRATDRVGLGDFTIHDLRHHAAVHMAKAGTRLNLMQRQLGHANIDQTMKYAEFNPEYGDLGKYFQAVGEKFGVGRSKTENTGTEVPR